MLSFDLGGLVRSLLHAPRTRKRSIAAAAVAALALINSFLVAAPAQALNDTGTGGAFVPATGRILDTKNNIGGYDTPMPAKTWRTVTVAAGVPADGSVGATSLDPTFSAGSGADSSLRSDAANGCSVRNTADTTQQPIATSSATNDDWQAPTGTFTDGGTYWVAPTIAGASGWDGSEATLSLPATSFTVSSITAEPDQTADSTDSSGPAPVHVLDSGVYDHNVTTQKVISKKHVSSSSKLAAKKGVIGACHAYNTKTPCSVSANRTVTSTVNTSAGYSKGGVSASIGFSDGVSTTVTVGCGSREISAGQTLYGLAVGDDWTYKIQTTTQDRFHRHPASVKTSSTLWAFNPHKSAISCAVHNGFPLGSGS